MKRTSTAAFERTIWIFNVVSYRIVSYLCARWEDLSVYLDPAVSDRLLPTARRDHPADVARRAADRQVPALHHDPRHLVHHRHRHRPQHPLPLALHPHHVALGPQGLPPDPPTSRGTSSSRWRRVGRETSYQSVTASSWRRSRWRLHRLVHPVATDSSRWTVTSRRILGSSVSASSLTSSTTPPSLCHHHTSACSSTSLRYVRSVLCPVVGCETSVDQARSSSTFCRDCSSCGVRTPPNSATHALTTRPAAGVHSRRHRAHYGKTWRHPQNRK